MSRQESPHRRTCVLDAAPGNRKAFLRDAQERPADNRRGANARPIQRSSSGMPSIDVVRLWVKQGPIPPVIEGTIALGGGLPVKVGNQTIGALSGASGGRGRTRTKVRRGGHRQRSGQTGVALNGRRELADHWVLAACDATRACPAARVRSASFPSFAMACCWCATAASKRLQRDLQIECGVRPAVLKNSTWADPGFCPGLSIHTPH